MSNETKSEIGNRKSEMQRKLLYLFTRTPLHVGAGASVGAIDQPIIRERHTGFPVIPASSLKGTFADAWNGDLLPDGEKKVRVTTKKNDKDEEVIDQVAEAAWLFGSDNAKHAFAGALQFSEAKLLAFPIRSAKGSFAWIICPLMLQRAERDRVFAGETDELKQARQTIKSLKEPADDQAILVAGKLDLDVQKDGKVAKQIVLEEYTFNRTGNNESATVGTALAGLLTDPVWQEIKDRLVILSNGMMSFFAQNACEVAQHVRIDDETGTAAGGALFNQENVPSEALFYSVINAFKERTPNGQDRPADKALDAFKTKVEEAGVFQFGGDASTGLGYCTVNLNRPQGA